jgi:hypothetical protein
MVIDPAPATGSRLRTIGSSRYIRWGVQVLLLGLFFAAGYFTAAWWALARDATPLERICARVDYLAGLQQEIDAQALNGESRDELKLLVEECRTALAGRSEEDR